MRQYQINMAIVIRELRIVQRSDIGCVTAQEHDLEEGDTCMVNMGEATENDRKKIVITKDSKAFFHNNVDYCVGTG